MSDVPHRKERLILYAICASLCVMVFLLLKARLTNPSLTIQASSQEQIFSANTQTSSQGMGELGSLMQAISQNPKDPKVLKNLVEAFMQAEQWDAAENFARRLLAEDEKSFHARMYLGIILHAQKKDPEAAQFLEDAIIHKDDGAARYSLAVLYCYFLNEKEKGIAHLRAGLKDSTLSPELKKALEDELKKQLPEEK